jgi:glycine/D-amino acid oxidase-like deaminating enzyme
VPSRPHIAVIGAGAFGGWTALHLLEAGARVTLLDAWGPGNSRASSGGETRIMRCTYGPDQVYTDMAARALKLWEKYERRWKRQFLHRCGVLWMANGPAAKEDDAKEPGAKEDDTFERASIATLRAAKVEHRELSAARMKKLWPQVNFEGVEWGIHEPHAGYLDARASCAAVVEAFVAAGGKYRQDAVLPDGLETGLRNAQPQGLKPARILRGLRGPEGPLFHRLGAIFHGRGEIFHGRGAILHGGALPSPQPLKADAYVFACGPWLGKLFPDTIGDLIQPTKQDVFFFGAPAGDDRFTDAHLPVWGDHRGRFRYGIPGSLAGDARRGFKIADDTRGPAFDPTHGERVITPETLADIREYVAFRFPALKGAPLLETRVCQYEQTPDSHFIIDRQPANENVWIIGGGSGHGFKHGPAIGEMMAELILKDREPNARWRLGRFKKQ